MSTSNVAAKQKALTMPANYTHTTRSTGFVLTAAAYNADHQNHIDNMIPSIIDDYSANIAQMQETLDPGEVGTENPATSLADEIKQFRFALKELKGTTHWYESVSTSIAYLGANVFTGLQRIVRSVTGNYLELEAQENGAASGPNIELYRNSATPAAADFGGNINFFFKDSGGNKQFFGQIYSKMMDPTNGSEDGLIGVGTMRAGAQSDFAFESGTLRHVGTIAAVLAEDGAIGGSELYRGTQKTGFHKVARSYQEIVGPQASSTAQIDVDDTPPLVSEGAQLFSSGSWTPKSATNRIRIKGQIHWCHESGAGNELILALFQDNTLLRVFRCEQISNSVTITPFEFEHVAGSVTARTYTLREGSATGAAHTLNVGADGFDMGDKIISHFIVEEFQPS